MLFVMQIFGSDKKKRISESDCHIQKVRDNMRLSTFLNSLEIFFTKKKCIHCFSGLTGIERNDSVPFKFLSCFEN